MNDLNRQAHWEQVYAAKPETAVSWYQDQPEPSLSWIRELAPADRGRILDVGGGASMLVDHLLALPLERITVLDLSATALRRAKARLGSRSERVDWRVADVTEVADLGPYDLWHDRAVFHFLTDPLDRRRYVERARRTIRPGGHLLIATFAPDGPERCSNLAVCRYDADSLSQELGPDFALVRQARILHTTPSGASQPLNYGLYHHRPTALVPGSDDS